jgi:hypothetical protein
MQQNPWGALFSVHDKVQFLTPFLLHFPKIYPLSNIYLPAGRAGTAWEPSEEEDVYSICYANEVKLSSVSDVGGCDIIRKLPDPIFKLCRYS